MLTETLAIAAAKSTLSVAGKVGVELFLQKYLDHKNNRIEQMFIYIGEELELGESKKAWNAFVEQIDDPKIHAAIIDAARKAVDSFDEAPIPYIAKVVCMIKEKNHVTVDDRRLIRLLAECDNSLILTLKHFIKNYLKKKTGSEDICDTQIFKLISSSGNPPNKVEATISKHVTTRWPLENHQYKVLFQILKKNYWGDDAQGGARMGADSGPHVILIEKRHLDVLVKLFG